MSYQPWSQLPVGQLLWNQARGFKLGDDDLAAAATVWQRPDARVVRCSPTAIEVSDDQMPRLFWRPAEGAYDPESAWLIDADQARFAGASTEVAGARGDDPWRSIGEDEWRPRRDGVWRSLREVWPLLAEDAVPVAVAGVALAAWHAGHGFCSACGDATQAESGGWTRRCPRCDTQHFPRIDPAVIVALVDNQDRLLLGGQPGWGKMRSVFAGFVMTGESLEQAVFREVKEEVSLAIDHLHYFGSQPWPFPRSLMVAFTAHVDAPDSTHIDGREIVRADWFTRDEVRQAWAEGQIDPPPPISIARRLIEAWLTQEVG